MSRVHVVQAFEREEGGFTWRCNCGQSSTTVASMELAETQAQRHSSECNNYSPEPILNKFCPHCGEQIKEDDSTVTKYGVQRHRECNDGT